MAIAAILVIIDPDKKSPESLKELRDEKVYSDLNTIKQSMFTRAVQNFQSLSDFNDKYWLKLRRSFYCYYLKWNKDNFIFATKLESNKFRMLNKWDFLIYQSNGNKELTDPNILKSISAPLCNIENK